MRKEVVFLPTEINLLASCFRTAGGPSSVLLSSRTNDCTRKAVPIWAHHIVPVGTGAQGTLGTPGTLATAFAMSNKVFISVF